MPTLLRIGHLRVVIYTNDHRPAHVHVVAPERNATFYLNCPSGPVSLRGNDGLTARQIKRIAATLGPHATELCAAWKEIHANY